MYTLIPKNNSQTRTPSKNGPYRGKMFQINPYVNELRIQCSTMTKIAISAVKNNYMR